MRHVRVHLGARAGLRQYPSWPAVRSTPHSADRACTRAGARARQIDARRAPPTAASSTYPGRQVASEPQELQHDAGEIVASQGGPSVTGWSRLWPRDLDDARLSIRLTRGADERCS